MKTQIASLFLISILSVTAQTKKPCQEQFKSFETFYNESFNEKSFLTQEGRIQTLNVINDILDNCPSYSANIYVYGQEMLQKIIQPLNIGEEKTNWTNHLIALYDKQNQYFSNSKSKNEVKKILLTYQNQMIGKHEALKAFNAVYTPNNKAFTPEALNLYTNLLLTDLSQNNQTPQHLKRADELNRSILTKRASLQKELSTAASNHKQQLNTTLNSLDVSSKNISASLKTLKVNCQDWNDIYQTDFEKNKNQSSWLANALMRLDQTNCNRNNPLFDQMTQEYYQLDKNSKSALYMADVALHRNDKQNAIKYFTESANLESNTTEKARLYYRVADLYQQTDKAQAKDFASKSITANPNSIEAYILLAQLYANAETECFSNEVQEKTKYILAAQTIEQVIKANPKHEKSAKRISNDFMKNAPTAEEIKQAKIKGKTIHLGCWINQSVVVR